MSRYGSQKINLRLILDSGRFPPGAQRISTSEIACLRRCYP